MLKKSLSELFRSLDMDFLQIDNCLAIPTQNFIEDLLKVLDEIRTANDIADTWHIPAEVACKIQSVIDEILGHGEQDTASDIDSDESTDCEDFDCIASSSSDDEL